MDDILEKIKARRDELQAELERFVAQANAQVAVYQAAIAELEKFIPKGDEGHGPE